MPKGRIGDKHSYAKSIEDNAKQYGYKAANLINLQKLIKDFNDSPDAESLGQLYGGVVVKVPEFKVLSANIIGDHLNKHAPEWLDLFNQFKASFDSQENKNNLSDDSIKKLEELQRIIINSFQDHPLSDESIAAFLQQNGIDNQQLLMVRSTGAHEDKADMANPGGNESLPCLATSEAISAALGRVAASYVSAKSLSQRLIAGDQSITELPVMPGLIQTMVGEGVGGSDQDKTRTVVSGVVYSNEGTTRLQSSYGHGEYVVNSKGKVDNFYITGDGLVYSEIMPKDFRLKPVGQNTDEKTKISLERVDNPANLKYAPSMDTNSAVYLHELSKFLEQSYDKRMDLEFVYNPADSTNPDSKPTINIVQARAIPEGARKGLQPSAVAPEFLARNKSQLAVIDGLQVITPEVNRAAVISKTSQVIIASTIEQALSSYNQLANRVEIKAVIVEQPSPDTSHEAGVFNAGGIAVMQVRNTEAMQSLLSQNPDQPLIVDPQHSKIYQLTEKFNDISPQALEEKLYEQNILATGIYASALSSYVTVDKYNFAGVDRSILSKEPVAITRDNKKLGNLVAEAQSGKEASLEQLLAISYQAMSYGQGEAKIAGQQDSAQRLRDNLEILASPKINGNNDELRQALSYNLRIMADSYKKQIISADLFKQTMISGSELSKLLDQMEQQQAALPKEQQDKIYLEYFNVTKKFVGLFTGHGNSLATSLAQHKYQLLATELAPEIEGEAKGFLVESLKLKDYLISKEQQQNWQKFCEDVCRNEQGAKALGQLVDKIVAYNVHEQWLNYIFTDSNIEDPKQKLAKFASDFAELDLAPISLSSKRIKSLEAQIPEWSNPSKFPALHQKLQTTLKEINKELKWNKDASNLEKILILEQVNKLTDVLDKSTKSLTNSPLYTEAILDDKGNNLQAARFKDLLVPFYGLMENWVKNTEFKRVDLNLHRMTQFLTRKDGIKLTKAELSPSANFAVNAATVDISGILAQPQTLEDFFTLIHQNTIVALANNGKGLNKIIEPQYPALVRQLNEQLNTQIHNDGSEIIPSTAIKLANGEVNITKNLPLREHSCIAEIKYNAKKDLTSVKLSLFGKNEKDRFNYISMANNIDLTIAGMEFVSTPYFDPKKEMTEFEVKITDPQQVETVIKVINQSIEMSDQLSEFSYTEDALNALVVEWITKLSVAQDQDKLDKIAIIPGALTWLELKEAHQTNPEHSDLIIQNYSEIKTLAGAGLPIKEFITLYDNPETRDKANLLLENAFMIIILAEAGLLAKEFIALYDNPKTRGKAEFLLSQNAAYDIKALIQAGLPIKEFMALYDNPETKGTAEFLLNKAFSIKNLAEAGLSAKEFIGLYDNPETIKKTEFLLNESHNITALAEAGLSAKEFIALYDNPETKGKAEFLLNGAGDIMILFRGGLLAKEFIALYDNLETKSTAEFILSKASDIRELAGTGLLAKEFIALYNNPKTRDAAELIVDNHRQIIPILKDGKLTREEIVKCDKQQIIDLLSGKLKAETLKELLTIKIALLPAIAQPALLIMPATQGVHVQKLKQRNSTNSPPLSK